jgi:DNA repair protein RadC
LFIELVSLGSVSQTVVEPMEVYSFALQKRAVKIILVHNHPSGELIPSDADKDVTDRLIQVGLIVNVPVYDHLIITENSYFSFNDSGLMEELSQSTKYVPHYVLEARYKKEAEEMNAVLVVSKIVTNLLKDGSTIEHIMMITGLPEDEVKKLKAEFESGEY